MATQSSSSSTSASSSASAESVAEVSSLRSFGGDVVVMRPEIGTTVVFGGGVAIGATIGMAAAGGIVVGVVALVVTGRCRGSLAVSVGIAGVDVELMELDERGCTTLRMLLLGVAAITGFGAIGIGTVGGLDFDGAL